MRPAEIVAYLNAEGVFPFVDNGRLKTRSASSALPARAVELLRAHRDALVAFLDGDVSTADGGTIIPRMQPGTPAPLSFAQRRLWFLHQLDPAASAAYHVGVALALRGPLDIAALRATLTRITERHQVLRTCFVESSGEPMQHVRPLVAITLPVFDVRGDDVDARVGDHLRAVNDPPFDLATGGPLRTRLLRTADDEHLLAVTMHHIVSDAWSSAVLARELREIYAAMLAGRPDPLPMPSIQYSDYAAWQRTTLDDARLQAEVGYWTSHLEGAPALLDVPSDHPRPPRQRYTGERVHVRIDAPTSAALKSLAARHRATHFMVFLAAWATLLHRLSRQGSVVVGCAVANRQRPEVEPLIGFFANTMPLHIRLEDAPTVGGLLAQVRELTLDGYAHQNVPFETIVDAVRPERSLGHAPLFQASLTVAGVADAGPRMQGLEVEPLEPPRRTAQFDLALALGDGPEGFSGELTYASDLFDRGTIDRWLVHFGALLRGMAADDTASIAAIDLLSPAQRVALDALSDGGPAFDAHPELTPDRIARWIRDTPDAPAVLDGEVRWTFTDLDRAADAVAGQLRDAGVGAGDRVALVLDRDPWMVAAILGAWRIGAAYVPLDVATPSRRLAAILADAAPRAIVVRQSPVHPVPLAGLGIPLVAVGAPASSSSTGAAVATPADRTRGAYLIYTSGSSGRPKGVVVSHGSLAHYLDRARVLYAAETLRAGVVATTLAFDATVTSLLLPLAVGRCVHLLPSEPQAMLDALGHLLAGRDPLLFKLTPAHLDALANLSAAPGTAAHCVVVGGEALSTETASRFRERVASQATLHNEYGPTEATVGCTTHAWAPGATPPPDAMVPIGRPLPGMRIDVLDALGHPVPVGVSGEIQISGPQLADGYLGEAGDAGFGHAAQGRRTYRTGDLARWGVDGDLQFIGRSDAQVKIRGYRVEPGDVEARLVALDQVDEAVVVAAGEGASRRLVAYLVASADRPPMDVAAVRAALADHLPAYMLPESVVPIDRVPMTANGKRDVAALPAALEPGVADDAHAPPETETERALLASWCVILDRPGIGIDTDFFALGGHSLLATRAVADIARRLSVTVPLRAVFEHPTIRRLARHVDRHGQSQVPLLPRGAGVGPVMSHAQKRLWILDQVEGGSRQYHIASALRIEGALDMPASQRALDGLVDRHEVLRTRYLGDGTCSVADVAQVRLTVHDLRGSDPAIQESRLVECVRDEVARPFDLAEAPLMRASLLQLDDADWVAVLTVHHIASDGGSSALLVREFTERYAAALDGREPGLTPLPVQYGDYALWQHRVLDDRALEAGLAYWRERLDAAPAVHGLPLDRARPAQRAFTGGRVERQLDRDLSSRLRELARSRGATSFMLLHAAFAALLGRWSGEHDIVVGSPVSGRAHPATEALIGCFVNSVAIRTQLEGVANFEALLEQVRTHVLGALSHQAVPFDLVVDAVNPPRSLSHAPVFQISFTLHQDDVAPLRLPGATVEPIHAGTDVSRFDLELHVRDQGDVFDLTLLFAAELFDAATIERLGDGLATLLASIADAPTAPLGGLASVSVHEAGAVRALGDPARVERPAVCAHQLFEEWARLQPDHVALQYDGESWTYAELDARANRIAHFLRAQGAGAGTRVGLCMERGHDLVAGLLAVLKAGAAYVPLDPAYPEERIAGMLDEAAPLLVLTQEGVLEAQPALGSHSVFPLDGALADMLLGQQPAGALAPLSVAPDPGGPAYVVFTSGSSGRPKGVVVPHRGMVNLALAQRELYGVGPGDRVLAFASVSFDGAVWEWLMALANGAALCMCDEDTRRSPARLARLLAAAGITHAAIPPAFLAQLDVASTPAPRVLFVAGEACDEALAWRWAARCRVVNSYGPTEGTVAATTTDILPGQRIVLGRALPNVELRVLDEHRAPVPVGVAGELYIGGVGLAAGYLGNPSLTTDRFFDGLAVDGGRLYRSGDRVRWNSAGELEFLGRVDEQMKIRGHRVEPGDIAAALRQHAAVSDAVVVLRGDGALRRLVAYLTTADTDDSNEALLAKALRDHLKARLPDYMVPAAFVVLDTLPLTSNGKVDARRLPEPDYQAQGEHVAARDARERCLAAIWQEVLRLDTVGVHDNFFEIGGDSILAIQVVARANQAGVAITTRHLFIAQTVAELAALAAGLDAPAPTAIQDATEGGQVLLPVHRLLIGLDDVDRHHYNQAVLLRTPPDFEVSVLTDVVRAVYARHDALRLRFAEAEAAGWTAWYAPLDEAMVVDSIGLERLPDAACEITPFVTARCNAWQSAFDLAHGPLLRVVYFQPASSGGSGRLLLLAQHFVVDGVSWRTLLADVERAYAQAVAGEPIVLDAKTSSFQEWGQALAGYATSESLAAETPFWLAQCRREVAPLPTDHSAADVGLMSDNALVSGNLDAAQTRALQQDCPAAYRTHINELLLAGVYMGLRAWSGLDAFRVRMEGHGREDLFEGLDVTQTVGYFTGIYPLVLAADSDQPGAVVRAIKEQYRAVPHHGVGFGIACHLGGDPAVADAALRLGPPDLEFNYLGQFDNSVNAGTTFQAAEESVGDKVSPRRRRVRRLGLTGRIFDGQLTLVLDYSRTQYTAETVQCLLDGMLAGLRTLIAHLGSPDAAWRTSSDFPLARIDQARLDAFQQQLGSIAALYPATPMQAGLHFHSQLDRSAYVVQSYPTIDGPLDTEAFRAAWDAVLSRHEILRTAFVETDGVLHQVVLGSVRVPWQEEDWRGLDAADQDARFAVRLADDAAAGFVFDRAPLLRLAVFRLSDTRHRILWTQHHITLDGWSGPIVYRDVLAIYAARTGGLDDTLAPPAAYGRYMAWLAGRDTATASAYWRRTLAGIALPTPLVVDRLPTDGGVGHREQRVRLSVPATRALESLAQRLKVTVNTLLQWSWAHVLHRYSGQDTVVFGTTLSGRPPEVPGIESMVGLFIQTIPVSVRFQPSIGIAAALRRLHAEFAESAEHGFLPLPHIQREAGGAPLFDSLLVFENLPTDAREEAAALPGKVRISRQSAAQFTHYRMTIIAVLEETLLLRFGYRAAHFAEDTVERMTRHLLRVLEELPEAVSADRSPSLMDADERALIAGWNATETRYPRDSALADLFEARAALHGDSIAVQAGQACLSYGELNTRANRLAHGLRARGVAAEVCVAVVAPRGLDMLVAMLAVLKAGGAYVPIDPALPAERVRHLIDDAGPALVLAAPACALESEWLSLDAGTWAGWPGHDPGIERSAHDLAYVMYTSGSTGRPKGVMVENRNVVRLVIGSDYAVLSGDDCVAHCSNPAFDASTWEVWAPLLHGARIVVLDQETVLHAPALRDALLQAGVTAMWMTVGLFNQYVETLAPAFARMRHLLVGGDALDPARIAWLAASPWAPARLVNGYGPTESTTFALTHTIGARVDVDRPVPIGRPIANTTVHVLDAELEPVPVGVVGEICIGGDGLARGYLGQPDETAERFVFTAGHGRLYRSGDLGRWLPDGVVEFVGRRDGQVKLRGYRIEPGEIESALAAMPGVRGAVVIARDDVQGERQLVGYVAADAAFETTRARRQLALVLPGHMVPAAIVALPRLPLTANGKVDRAELPMPDWSPNLGEASPATETESQVHRIWCDVLGLESVGTDRAFFDVGGHSLLATRVVAAAQAEFGCELRVADLFAHPTIIDLAAWIDALQALGRQDSTHLQNDDVMETAEW